MSTLAIFAGLAIVIFGMYFIIGIATCVATDIYNRNARERQHLSSNYYVERHYTSLKPLNAVSKTNDSPKEATVETRETTSGTEELRKRSGSEETHAADES